MNFKLLALPEMARIRVFGSLSPMELLELSLCSKTTDSIIVSSRSARYSELTMTNRDKCIEICVKYRKDQEASVYFIVTREERQPMNQRRVLNGVCFRLRKTIHFGNFEIATTTRIQCSFHIVDFLYSLFNPKSFKIRDMEKSDTSRFLPQALCWLRAKQVDHVVLSIKIDARLINEMLGKWFWKRKRLELGAKVENPENLMVLPKFELLTLSNQNWLTPEKFCTLDAKIVSIEKCDVTIQMLILFIQKWMDNPGELRYLKVKEPWKSKDIDYRDLISTFWNEFLDKPRNVRNPQYFDPKLLGKVDVSEGKDIRSHGRLATLILKPNRFHFCVWD